MIWICSGQPLDMHELVIWKKLCFKFFKPHSKSEMLVLLSACWSFYCFIMWWDVDKFLIIPLAGFGFVTFEDASSVDQALGKHYHSIKNKKVGSSAVFTLFTRLWSRHSCAQPHIHLHCLHTITVARFHACLDMAPHHNTAKPPHC